MILVLLLRKEHKKDKFIFNFRTSKLNHLIPDFTMTKLIFIFFAIISTKNVIAQDWDKVYKEKEGLRLVLKDGKYGYINSSDKVVIKPQFKDAYNFNADGYATIKIDGKKGKINKEGKIIVPAEYEKIFLFKEGFHVFCQN